MRNHATQRRCTAAKLEVVQGGCRMTGKRVANGCCTTLNTLKAALVRIGIGRPRMLLEHPP